MAKEPQRHNWAAAFFEYLSGAPLLEIAKTLRIPLPRLKKRAREERWATLAGKLAMPMPEFTGGEAERAIQRIQENRERNLQVARGMQEDLEAQLNRLLDGTLSVTRQMPTGEPIEMPAGLKERLDLANYAKMAAELSYRAVGDWAPSRTHENGSGNASGTSVTVILPEAVAEPRSARESAPIAPAAVIDITPGPGAA